MAEFHLDPLGGIAGDMFVAAMLHIRPDLEPGLRETLLRCPMIEDVSVEIIDHNDGVLTGRCFLVNRIADEPSDHHHHDHSHHQDDGHHDHHDENHDHPHAHHHTAWRDIRAALEQSRLDPAIIRHAIGIFALLAEAEARVHGTTSDKISFHEVGAWDSIADIVSAAFLITMVDASRWTIGPVPLGSGRIRTAHGILPVPAPATALLLEGFVTIDDGIGGERVTPTGAAILRYLCRAPASPSRRTLAASGHGFGTKTLPGISNCLRVLAFHQTRQTIIENHEIVVIECEIDDQTGEDLAHAIDHLRAHDGVLDVIQAPVFGKKGRMMAHLRVLTRPDALQTIADLIFSETSTIGIRHCLAQRLTLPRQSGEVTSGGRQFRVKTVTRPGFTTTKVEADDLAGVAGKAARDTFRANFVTGDKSEDR